MQRKGYQVFVVFAGVGIVVDVGVFVGCHHGEGLVVDVGDDACLGHLFDDPVPGFGGCAGDADQVEVVAAVHVVGMVVQVLEAQFVTGPVVFPDDLFPSFEEGRVPVQLLQADGGHDVGHVAFVPGADDVVFPGADLGFGQGVLALAVEGEQLVELIDLGIVYALNGFPGAGAALRGGEVLHGMEGEGGKVGDGAAVFPFAADDPAGAQAVGVIRNHGDPADGFLDFAAQVAQRGAVRFLRGEAFFFIFNDFVYGFIVRHDTAQVHHDDGLRFFGDGVLQGGIVHLRHAGDGIAVLLNVNESDRGAAVDHCGSGGGVGIGGNKHFIPRADAQDPEVQFLRRRGGAQADQAVLPAVGIRFCIDICPAGFNIGSQPSFQALDTGAGGDPAGLQGVHHFLDFGAADIRRAEGNDFLAFRRNGGDVDDAFIVSDVGEVAGVVDQLNVFLFRDGPDGFPEFRADVRLADKHRLDIVFVENSFDVSFPVNGHAVQGVACHFACGINNGNGTVGGAFLHQMQDNPADIADADNQGVDGIALIPEPVQFHHHKAVGETDQADKDELERGAENVYGDRQPLEEQQRSENMADGRNDGCADDAVHVMDARIPPHAAVEAAENEYGDAENGITDCKEPVFIRQPCQGRIELMADIETENDRQIIAEIDSNDIQKYDPEIILGQPLNPVHSLLYPPHESLGSDLIDSWDIYFSFHFSFD